jgi:hypothetical protein
MNTSIVASAGVIIAILVVVAMAWIAHRRSEQRKRRFGSKYDHAGTQQRDDTRRAEATIAEREKRIERLPLRSLSPIDREAYAVEWAAVQRRFVDDPPAAVGYADRLISRMMTDRGYPMTDFERRAADISASYPAVVENYRAAHDIALHHADGSITTEDLRRAMVHYRSLFDELLVSAEFSNVEPINRRRGVTHERAS